MAIRAPDTSLKLMQIFNQLGEGIRDVANPNLEQERLVRRFLLQNPDRARQLARVQGQGESADQARQAIQSAGALGQGMVGAPGPGMQQEPTNVLAAFGLSPEETGTALGLAGVPGPVRQLEEERAQALREADAPEAEADATVAEAEATGEEAVFRQRFFQQLDPTLRAQAENLQNERDTAYSEQELQSLSEVDEILRERPELRLAFAGEGGRTALQAILAREEMNLEDRISRIEAAGDLREQRREELKFRVDMRNELRDRMDDVQELVAEQPEGWKDQVEARLQEFNETASLVSQVDPRDTAFVANMTKGLFGSVGIEFNPTPGSLEFFADRPDLLQKSSEVLATARTQGGTWEDFKNSPIGERLISEMPNQMRVQFRRDFQDNLRAFSQQETLGEGGGVPDNFPIIFPDGRSVNVPVGDIRDLAGRIGRSTAVGINNFFAARQPGTERVESFEEIRGRFGGEE